MRLGHYFFVLLFSSSFTALHAPLLMADSGSIGSAGIDQIELQVDPGMLLAIQEQFGLSEAEALRRLQAEALATMAYAPLKAFLGDAYAGAWFDAEREQLVVGLIDMEQADFVRVTGAYPVSVQYSYSTLRQMAQQVSHLLDADESWRELIMHWHVDKPTNKLVVGATPTAHEALSVALRALGMQDDAFRIEASHDHAVPLSSIRGADCFENPDSIVGGNPIICSVGFSVNGGYITAGHCGIQSHMVSSCSGAPQGLFSQSNVSPGDIALVTLSSGWLPLPEVTGYTIGNIAVQGAVEAPVGTTVCRLGQASQGPHCSTIISRNATIPSPLPCHVGTCIFDGLILSDMCGHYGDSGGPLITASGQAQGSAIAVQPEGTCPNPSLNIWFEPVAKHLTTFGSTLLTANGGSPPTITNFICPNPGNSGQGMFSCLITHNTQGTTLVNWTSSTGHTSPGGGLFGTCSANEWVTVQVIVTNAWGSDGRINSFWCPMNPLH